MKHFYCLLFLLLISCKKDQGVAVDRLQPCKIDQGPTDAYCGKLSVFEDRKARQGRKIDLKIIVQPALRRDPKADPLFLFAGGPGQGAAKLAGTLGAMFRRFQNDRDLVMIDQRGTGDSNPMPCDFFEKGKERDDLSDITDEMTLARFKACLASYNADPKQYTTPVAMDDIDEVRQYLGYKTINLWGGSYGTRAALVYLRQHEDTVRSVILDGVAPTGMRLPLFMARDSQRSLDLLVADCEADKACSAKFPDLRKTIAAVIARADSKARVRVVHPRTGERFEIPLTPNAIRSVIFSTLYAPSVASLLPRLLQDAAQGDFQGLFAMGFISEGGAAEGIAQGMFLSVICAEDVPFMTPRDIEQATNNTFLGKAMLESRIKACEFWPKGEVPAGYTKPVVSSKPVLILSGAADPVTPPTWGQEAAATLQNSRHIVVPGAGHGVSSLGCVPKIIGKFLETASVAGLDDSCVKSQKRPPFFINYAGPVEPGASAK